jgi:hypothetical protein
MKYLSKLGPQLSITNTFTNYICKEIVGNIFERQLKKSTVIKPNLECTQLLFEEIKKGKHF